MRIRLLFVVLLCLAAAELRGGVRYVRSGEDTIAAVVDGDERILHTPQVFGRDAAAALERLGDVGRIVRLNVVATTQQDADAARVAIRERYPAESRPAVSVVVSALAPADATVGIDAVAVSPTASTAEPLVYISGQAEKGATPADAAAKTIAALLKTLEFVRSTKTDVMQAKCFLTPMSAAPDVVREFEKVFGDRVPPLVFVEWKSNLPIEIELIAVAPAAPADAPAVEYLTPPGVKPSPLFARVVRVNRGDRIYTAGLYADQPSTGEAQVLSVFEQLQSILKQTGGDMRHLVKATYFVSDDDASKQLNVLRPKFYDPQRPPAASKAMVPGTGMTDRSIAIDMIGVLAPPPTK